MNIKYFATSRNKSQQQNSIQLFSKAGMNEACVEYRANALVCKQHNILATTTNFHTYHEIITEIFITVSTLKQCGI